ncbi:hypothetical protein [Microbacterium dauci]|uniref:ABC transporter n=1 Tax=Microbacterium dauci TaxID=3048008 RepID=A0ABT6ZFY3_9MICO|nr:hypothetical protein [Microbacterium sp. LX3-4]MDJ1114645.1 hypothetical protein [Microbacterium sp. LX3-4]
MTRSSRRNRPSPHRRSTTAVAALALFALTGCQSVEPAPVADSSPSADVPTAKREIDAPARHLTTLDADGGIHHLDQHTGLNRALGAIEPAETLATEGRYLYASRPGSVSIVDSGAWTWSHGDHFHYYEAPAVALGELTGEGAPVVVANDHAAGVFFDGGEAVLLDAAALADGERVERFRLDVEPHAGMVVPLRSGALVTDPRAGGLRHVGATGETRAEVECAEPAGAIATAVGVVVGCADGAVLAVTGAGATTFERIPYPDEVTERARTFEAREGRPTVAGLTGDETFWLLDTRERSWTSVDAGFAPVLVTAVDDTDETVVALAPDGSVVCLDADGLRWQTGPLVAASLADEALATGIELVVDADVAALNDPAGRRLIELDLDTGDVSSTSTDHLPLLLAGTGR